jgi:IS30 family transposase
MCRRRLRSGVRTPLLTDCRRIISARLHEQGYSFTEIGEELRRHPTTVFRLVQTHQTLLEGDPVYPKDSGAVVGEDEGRAARRGELRGAL